MSIRHKSRRRCKSIGISIMHQIGISQPAVFGTTKRHRTRHKNPIASPDECLATLEGQKLPQTVAILRGYAELIYPRRPGIMGGRPRLTLSTAPLVPEMSWWLLFIFVTLTWFAWCAGAILELKADKLEGKCPPDAGCSLVPIVPLYPLALFGIAMLLDKFLTPWGTRIILWFHIALGILFAAAIIRDLNRIRRIKRHPPLSPISK
jgi:hypothetical protein